MSDSKRKKQKHIRFELSIWGVFGIGVVCFCIFLWMFLLGIWAGQTILLSSAGLENALNPSGLAHILQLAKNYSLCGLI